MGLPILGICYGLQFIAHHLGGKVRTGAQARVRPCRSSISKSRVPAVCRPAAYPAGVDESRRRSAGAACRLSSHRRDLQRAGRHRQRSSAKSGPCSFIQKSTTRRSARSCCAILSSTFAAPAVTGRRALYQNPRSLRSAKRWANGHVICALSGGVDSSVAAMLVHQAPSATS